MTRNANENEFRTSKMAAGGHFVKKNESCVFIWNDKKCKRKWISDIQNGRRRPFSEKNESCVLIWNVQKCKQKLISDIQNGCRRPFSAKKMKVAFWSEMVRNANKMNFRHPKWPPAAILRKEWKYHFSTIFKGAGHLIYDSILFDITSYVSRISRYRLVVWYNLVCFPYFPLQVGSLI